MFIRFQQFKLGCENVMMTSLVHDNDQRSAICDIHRMLQGCLKPLEYDVFNCLITKLKVIQNSKRKR